MVRRVSRLTARQVTTLGEGFHPDGDGLYLQVTAGGSRSWIYRYRAGKTRLRDMGLGPVRDVSLQAAREAAGEARKLRAQGIDPIEARTLARVTARSKGVRLWGDAVRDLVEALKPGWRSTGRGKRIKGDHDKPVGSQENQWIQSLETYGPPFDLPVTEVDSHVVLKSLRPIWKARDQGGKPETATRVRGRIERVWEAERVAGVVSGDNPARWKGHLEHLLPQAGRLKQSRHHPALPYDRAPELYSALRFRKSKTARALRFLLLTAARTGEVTGMPDLSEIDFEKSLWRIPAERMKAAVDHEVPLVAEAIEILKGLAPDKPPFHLSENSMLVFLQRAAPKGLGMPYTVHGMRSTFRDWASETTDYSREVAEMAIAHQIKDKTEAAYRRGKLRDKRRLLMTDWHRYLLHGAPVEAAGNQALQG